MKQLLLVYIILHPLFMLSQETSIYDEMDRTYGIEVEIENDSVVFSYRVDFHASDTTKKYTYKTDALDTFLIILDRDISLLPDTKNNLLFYIHGMMGGQWLNLKTTASDLTKYYLEPEKSDVGRLLWIRWPGNLPVYAVDKENAEYIAADLSELLVTITDHVTNKETEGGNNLEVDILAHSLGSELFKNMYMTMRKTKKCFGDILFCAPDLDVDVFNEGGPLADLHIICRQATVYYSSKDLTLGISSKLNNKGRLGFNGPDARALPLPEYNFVDMTLVNDETFLPFKLTGHAYYRGSNLAAADMLESIIGTTPVEVALRKPITGKANHYRLEPK